MNKKLRLLLTMLTVVAMLGTASACLDYSGSDSSSNASESSSSLPEKKESYTVRFVNEDNSIISEKKYEEGTMPEAPANPTYEADHYTYVFAGWDKEIVAVEDDVIYKAVYTKTAINYTVTFMADGVQVGEALTYNMDNPTVTAPDVPAKEGYGGSWENYTLDGGDKVVNAVYKLGEYTVTFKADGETVATDTYTMNDKEITVPDVPAKDHYTGTWEAYELTTGDVVVNAVYTAIDYTVTFMAGGEQVGEVLSYNLDNPTVTEPTAPAKEHYTGAWEEYILDGGDKVINAVYTAINYTVTFMADGVQVGEALTYNMDNPTVTAPDVPAKEGYGGSWESYTLDGGDKVVNAVYKLGEYTVTFKADGEVVGTETYTINDKEITVPDVPAKDHYTGVWEAYELTTGDVTVNAVYTAIDYTVTFKADGVQVGEVLSYNMDNPTVTAPAVPAKDHYTGAWESYELNGGNKVVNAVYTGIEYSVIFLNEAGEEVGRVAYALDNTDIVEPAVPAKKGYTGVWANYALNGGDVTVSPEYTINTYKIIYDAGNGTASMATQEVVYGDTYTIEATATSNKSYQDFLGWVDEEGNLVSGGVWEFDTDVTLTAQYTDGITFEKMATVPSYVSGDRIQAFSIVEINGNKALEAKTTDDSTSDVKLALSLEFISEFFEDENVAYLALDVMSGGKSTDLLNGATNKEMYYNNGSWTRFENGNSFHASPTDAFKSYYVPRSAYEAWVSANTKNPYVFMFGGGLVCGGQSFYVDNIRPVTEAEHAADWWSFEYGDIRLNNGSNILFYRPTSSQWELNFSNIDRTTAKFTNDIVSDGNRAFTFKKNSGKTNIVLNHTTDTAGELEMRAAGYISYDLYVPEGSNATTVQDNSSGVYATLKQGWNTIYAKVDATDNTICTFWDSTASTYVIDNIRLLTKEQYDWEMLSFEGKAGVLRDNFSSDKTFYIYTPRDVLDNRWSMAVQGSTDCTLSNLHYDTEIVMDGKQSFAFHKTNAYMSCSFNTGGEMYALLKNGFTCWVYADLDEQPMINGKDTSNFGNGANGKFNGGEGINISARTWTQITVTAADINDTGRWLIIQGSTAGTYYFDGFEPLVADAE